MKRITRTKVIIALCIAVIAGCAVYAPYRLYVTQNSGLSAKKADKTDENDDTSLFGSDNENIDVMLACPADWRQIASKPLLTHEKFLGIDGVSNGNENLIGGDYPFTVYNYTVIRSDEPEDSVYRRLRDYMLTEEGQEIIRLAGCCHIDE